ncbi:MAG: AMP-binding protein [Syntrophaceae bacterium]|nr:AMP-binding protein [Syntrophaceae bacterium]
MDNIREREKDQLDTLPKLLKNIYEANPNGVALRVKNMGIWQKYTWSDYYNNVKYLALGLVSLGLKRGDKISILGENKPEWYYAELAAQSVGAIAVGIFSDCIASEVKFYVEHSDSVFVIAHDQEQVDKVLDIIDEIPLLKKIVYWDPKGMWSYQNKLLCSFDEVVEMGRNYEKFNPEFFDKTVATGNANDIGVICYTSGTTGQPRGAMLSQRWLVDGTRHWAERDDWKDKGFNYVSFLPGAWAAEQGFGIAGNLCAGVRVNFPESTETVQTDLREIGPELLFYGARMWELVNRNIQAKMIDSTLPRRLIYRICLPIGLKVAKLRSERKVLKVFWRLIYFGAYYSFFKQLRDNLGLSKARIVYSAGAAISPDIIHFFQAMGIEIKLYYGSTESGAISVPETGHIRPETTGPPLPWVKVKISEEGEILVKNEYMMFAGYYKDSKATEDKIKDGWYQTGDFGYVDDEGHLIVIDRMGDLKSLKSGKKFSPQYTEIRLRFSPYIKDALVIGDKDREYVVCLINIDIENVGQFAEKKHIEYTTFSDISQKPEVIELIRGEIIKVNRTLPDHARIKKFVNLDKELDPDDEELTRTRKLRRSFVENRYSDLIEAIYSSKEYYESQESITYRDGRKGSIKMAVKVNWVEEEGV